MNFKAINYCLKMGNISPKNNYLEFLPCYQGKGHELLFIKQMLILYL